MSIKGKVADAGHAMADCAKNFGQKVADGAKDAVEFVKDKVGMEKEKDFGLLGVKEHMEVVGCCGGRVGTVDHVEGNAIKLTIGGNNTITASAVPVTIRNGIVAYTGAQSYTAGTTLANAGASIQFSKLVSMPATGSPLGSSNPTCTSTDAWSQ